MIYWFETNEALIQSALAMSLLAFSVQVALRGGVFSLAGVGFWAIGGYSVAKLVQEGWATVPAIAAALLVTGVMAFGLALILGRLRSLYLAMATFAFVLIVQIVALNWESVTGGAVGLFAIPVTVTTLGVGAVVVAVSIFLIFWERGRRGRRFEALRLDEELAPTVGINVRRERIIVFVVSAVLGTLSGALNAMMFNTLTPDQAGFSLITTVLMMVVIGGTGAWWGALVGAIIVTWLPEVTRFADDFRPIIQGFVVILVVVYAPEGVVGLVRRIKREVMQRWPRGSTPSRLGEESR